MEKEENLFEKIINDFNYILIETVNIIENEIKNKKENLYKLKEMLKEIDRNQKTD